MLDKVDYGFSILSAIYACIDIQEIVSIVLLVISCANVVLKVVLEIIKAVKGKRIDDVPKIIDDAIDTVQDKIISSKEEKTQ